MRIALILVVAVYVMFCGWLVVASGLFDGSLQGGQSCILLQQTTPLETVETTIAPASNDGQVRATQGPTFGAYDAPAERVTLGSVDPESGYKYLLELSSRAAAIRRATFSEFDNRDHKDPQPLEIISPIPDRGGEILAMANTSFVFAEQLLFGLPLKFQDELKLQDDLDSHTVSEGLRREFENNGCLLSADADIKVQDKDEKWLVDNGEYLIKKADENTLNVYADFRLRLEKLHWIIPAGETASDTARFKAIIKNKNTGKPVIELTKTYRVRRDSYLLDCDITVENVGGVEQKVRFNMTGPGGLGREAVRADMRKIVAGFRNSNNEIVSTMLDRKALTKGKPLESPGGEFLWVAATNKYFAAIVVPLADGNKNWVSYKTGRFYNPDGDAKADSGDETLGLDLAIASHTLAAAGQAGSSRTYKFQMYLGPKDKSLFDKNDRFRELGFFQTITFMPCFCCPTRIIHPLAFGILALMKGMYGFIGNYGVVIIILVFLMRLCLHPITKKSQVSMSKMSQLAPKAEEIKKKYANNKAEMNKQMMALYREQGASPIMGFLPMMVQMPIWIALWSAVYASIDLRGAAFLPFWITDLSMPDALFRFPAFTLPLFGKLDSFNLLPIMMGVAFYLQQQLMPTQANASANPQMAQQQKMMKIMMPLLFPLMLYKAPSGVNLYIMASTFAGVFEQHVIRKHIREKEQAESKGTVAATSKTGGKVKKKKPKPFYRT